MAQEIPFPESDASEIGNPSIDNGIKSGTQADFASDERLQRVMADIGEDPAPSGPDLVSQSQSSLQRLFDSPLASDLRERAMPIVDDLRGRAQDLAGEIPQRGRELYESAERRAKANPWITIAAASAGALAVGFLVGKLLKPKAAPYTEEEYPAGYDE